MSSPDNTPPSGVSFFHNRLQRSPILVRLIIGNTIVVIVGAILGSIIIQQTTSFELAELILLFLVVGIFFSFVMNYWIIRVTLLPLRELRLAVDRFKPGDRQIAETGLMGADPDIHRLLFAINSMLERLDYRTRLLRALSERVINAQEEERKRIARTLHDDTAQSLSTLIIKLERLEAKADSIPGKGGASMGEELAKLHELAKNILDDVHHNIWYLRPSILDDLGLLPAIRWLARMNLEEAGIEVNFNVPSENIRLPTHLETMLFRVTQEAINNIIRHSDAHKVLISLIPEKARVCLEIEDDGIGFDVNALEENAISNQSLGLLSIQERTTLVGGILKIDSQTGQGTRIHVCVPLFEMNGNNIDKIEFEEPGDASKLEVPLEDIS